MALIQNLKKYMADTLNLKVDFHSWSSDKKLPVFLRQAYSFQTCQILDCDCLLMVDKNLENMTPSTIRKHLNYLNKRFDQLIIYVADSVTSFNRNRLIKHHVSFIIPGNQIYLPEFGMDLREYFRSQTASVKLLSPATQCVFLFLMNNHFAPDQITASYLMEKLSYSRMTITRSFQEFKLSNLFRFKTVGREKKMSLSSDRKDTWLKAQSYLRNPVKHRFLSDLPPPVPPGLWSGFSALCRYSTLSGPDIPVVSMSLNNWHKFKCKTDSQETTVRLDEQTEIETWIYDPLISSKNDTVDPLSLYLSMKNTSDERVMMALEELVENIQW